MNNLRFDCKFPGVPATVSSPSAFFSALSPVMGTQAHGMPPAKLHTLCFEPLCVSVSLKDTTWTKTEHLLPNQILKWAHHKKGQPSPNL